MGADGDMALSPQSVLRVVTSRNWDVQYSGFRSLISTKKEVKITISERAIDELKYESEPSSDGDAKRLKEFLANLNELE